MTFEQWVLELWYFTWIFHVIRPFRGQQFFLSCTVSGRALIFHLNFPWIRLFRGYHYLLHCDLDLGVWPMFFGNFNLANNFWTLRARTILFFTLWPWSLIFFFLYKTLTLLITFKQWVIDLWYFIWIFPLIRTLW